MLGDEVLLATDNITHHFGERTRDEAKAFRARCAEMLSPEDFYLSVARFDNEHPWTNISGEALLASQIKDDNSASLCTVTMAHSDVAAAPHQTNELTFLKNALMDIDGYMDMFSVIGGNEQIVTGLVEEIDAEIRLNSNVVAVQPLPDGTYRLEVDVNGVRETAMADFVIVALPLTALSTINWRTQALQEAINRHIGYLDRTGHFIYARPCFSNGHFGANICPLTGGCSTHSMVAAFTMRARVTILAARAL